MDVTAYNQEHYGKAIREARRQKGLLQAQLAEKLGITANLVGHWEKGRARPDLNLVPQLCSELGISLDMFFTGRPGKNDLSREEQHLLSLFRALPEADRRSLCFSLEKVLEFRTLSKLNSTYVEGLLPLIGSDGRIRAHFQQTVTATGRISCTEPNLQNIPVRQELGRQLRKVFTAGRDDLVLIGADYSQIELRVLAHMSKDPTLIDAFNQGLDIHRETASKVFGVPQDQVTPLMRSNAKAVNFGVIYGMSAFGLSSGLP